MKLMMKLSMAVLLIVLTCAGAACSQAPVTGRSQLKLVPDSTLNSMAFKQYDQFLAEHQVIRGTPNSQAVKRVGHRIQQAVEQYLRQNDQAHLVEGFQWEFNLVASDEVNAWAMPGGKVVVYQGILPIARDEAGLATVMGHEIAHAVAGHGNERMSQQLVAQMGGMALEKAMSSRPAATQKIFMQAYGAGAQYGVLLPYSRQHESEADHLGLIFMAMAGYDPHAAVGFWQRMAAQSGAEGPEFMRTHPTSENRIARIKELIPEAMKYYNKP